jgi:hypothetical protein
MKLFEDYIEDYSEGDMSSYEWMTDSKCSMSDYMEHHPPPHMNGLQSAKACVDASAASYAKEAKKDIDFIFGDLYDKIKKNYKPKN